MRIFITGGTGFIGEKLTNYLLNLGHHVTSIGRSSQSRIKHEKFQYISADTSQKGDWQEALKDTDIAINLAGANIFKRWDDNYKKLIYESRIFTTQNLIEGLEDNKSVSLLSASAAGYYGNRKDDILSEADPPGKDFLATVCMDWEKEAYKAEDKNIRVATMRFGVVMGESGGALSVMSPLYKWFLGGPLGWTGKQWFPWIHVNDLISAINFLINKRDCKGPFNFVSPIPIRQKNFSKALGHVLERPSLLPSPPFIVKLIMGELGSLLLNSQKIIPDKLIKNGFIFKYLEIAPALEQIFKGVQA